MFRKIFYLTLLIALLLTACGSARSATPTELPALTEIKLTDGLGRHIVLNEAAQRVLSMAPSNTEILFAVGAGDQVVGRDDFSDYPEAAKNVASIGFNPFRPFLVFQLLIALAIRRSSSASPWRNSECAIEEDPLIWKSQGKFLDLFMLTLLLDGC